MKPTLRQLEAFAQVARQKSFARAAEAGMGPITNAIGMHLTAVIVHRRVISQPDPWGDVRGDTPLDECSRGMAAAVDETGLLWLCEKLIPRTEFPAA